MAENQTVYHMYRYRLKDFRIICPDADVAFNAGYDQVQSIVIDKDYDALMLPMFMVEVSIPNYVHRALKADKTTSSYVVLDFQMGSAEESLKLEDTKTANFKSYIKGNYTILLTDSTPDVLDRQVEKHEKTSEVYGKGAEHGDMVVTKMLLYNQSHWTKMVSFCNAIISSCTLIDAIAYVLNTCGLNNVIISPPSNFKTYKEFCITPISPMEQLDRICNEYGFHTNGTVVFFDFKYIYIVEKSPACKAWYTNEYTTTYLTSQSAKSLNSTQSAGCASNSITKTSMINIIGNSIEIKSLSEANDRIFGNNFLVINTASGGVEAVSAGTTPSPTSRVVMINKGDNTAAAVKREMTESNNIIKLGFSHIDLNMLTPNKGFVVSFDDSKLSKYNGKVRICRYSCIFQKEGAYFTPQVIAEFRG